jgi:hypothetical protein
MASFSALDTIPQYYTLRLPETGIGETKQIGKQWWHYGGWKVSSLYFSGIIFFPELNIIFLN